MKHTNALGETRLENFSLICDRPDDPLDRGKKSETSVDSLRSGRQVFQNLRSAKDEYFLNICIIVQFCNYLLLLCVFKKL